MPNKKRYRSVWISDIHLGLKDCKADYLLAFLNSIECERLYIVGDFIDFWQVRRGWRWTPEQTRVLQTLLDISLNGTRIIYTPGNHDANARSYPGISFGGIELVPEAIHETADGRRFLVLHGDQFDTVIRFPLPSWFCNGAYDFLLFVHRWAYRLRRLLRLPYWSLANAVKQQIPGAIRHIRRFEQAAAAEAKRRHLDGIICGHIHQAQIASINGVLYCNDGDWIESCTAMVEHGNGRFEIVHATEATVVLLSEHQNRLEKAALPKAAA
jgi:UDP-2,3-diacylglucosamine pyrophosphatase LpxH